MAWYLTLGPCTTLLTKVYWSLYLVLLLDQNRTDRPICDCEVQSKRGVRQWLAQYWGFGQVLLQLEERLLTLLGPDEPVVSLKALEIGMPLISPY